MIAEGVDIVTVSSRLGHADKKVTLNVYSHIIEAKEREVATHLEKYYGNLLDDVTAL